MAATGLRNAGSAVTRQLRQPPVFLAPALAELRVSHQSVSRFSTSYTTLKRDGNKNRGVSALRRKNPKQNLSVANEPLPQPVLDPKKRTKLTADPDHGLWGFFPADRKALMTPEDMASHGRSWAVEELRGKSWEDLHALWWVCSKEKNMILTQEYERQRLKAGYGESEATDRLKAVNRTQRAIKHALTERWYAYQNALDKVTDDPSLIDGSNSPWEDINEDDISTGTTESTSASSSGPALVPPEDSAAKQDRPRV